MVDKKYESFLLQLYQEIHIQHRQQTEHINQAVVFYIALLSFFIGFYKSLVKSYSTIIVNVVFFALFFITVTFISVLIRYRVWQLKYAIGLQLLGHMFLSEIEINDYTAFLEQINTYQPDAPEKHRLFTSITCKMIWGCIIISIAPIGLYYSFLQTKTTIASDSLAAIFLFVIIVYLISVYVYFEKQLEKTDGKDSVLWLVDFSTKHSKSKDKPQ